MQEDSAVLDIPDPEEQDDLVSENEPDFMENEQTWPTEEELAEADGKDILQISMYCEGIIGN
jgi:pre-rRNA-processing protein TSR1